MKIIKRGNISLDYYTYKEICMLELKDLSNLDKNFFRKQGPPNRILYKDYEIGYCLYDRMYYDAVFIAGKFDGIPSIMAIYYDRDELCFEIKGSLSYSDIPGIKIKAFI